MATTNPFDPAALRLDQTFTDGTAVKKLLTTIPVRKPGRQDWVRVHPDPAYRLSPTAIIELKDDRETYLVTPAIAKELVGEFFRLRSTPQSTGKAWCSLWAVRLPAPNGELDVAPFGGRCGRARP